MAQDTSDSSGESKAPSIPPLIKVRREDNDDSNAITNLDVEGSTARKKPLAFHLAFWGINIMSLVFSLDATTLAVAIPSIAKQLNGTTLQSFWASISYILCVVVTQPVYTTTSDVFGRKPPLYVGFAFFTAGSFVFALAQNMPTVIVGRVLQGLGGGGLDVLGEIIVADITTLQERSLYLGLKALPVALGSILGPTIGALFSSFVSWRWIGWINLPLLGASFPLVFFFLRIRPIDTPFRENIKRLDWGGSVLSLVGITVFVLPLSWAGALYPWKSWQTILPLIIGFVIVVGFAIYEAKPQAPIMPHRLFHSMTANMTLVGNFMHGAMLMTLLQYLPFFYQAVLLETVIESAVSLLPTSITSVAGAVGGVIIVGMIGKGYRWSMRFLWAAMTIGTGVLVLLDSDSSQAMRMGVPVIWGFGIGALMRLLHLPMQASVPSVDDTGLAIGVSLAIRLLGGLVGLALGSTIFSSVFSSSIAALHELPDSLAILRDGSEAIGFIPTLRTLDIPREELQPVLNAYLTAMRAIFYVMTGFGVLGFLSSVFTKELTLDKTDLGRQRFED